jgi:hypothetical protein
VTRNEWRELSLPNRLRVIADRLGTEGDWQQRLALALNAPRETVNRWANARGNISRPYQQKLAALSSWPEEAFRKETAMDQIQRQLAEGIEILAATGARASVALEQLQPLLEDQKSLVAELRTLRDDLQRLVTAMQRG